MIFSFISSDSSIFVSPYTNAGHVDIEPLQYRLVHSSFELAEPVGDELLDNAVV
jgi:hypothetical protein